MGELIFFLGLQVKKLPEGIFICQDKYVADILKKFDFLSIRTATTRIESNKPLVKDEDGVDVDVHVYMSMIDSLMYLTASRPDIMFAVCACARFQVTPKASYLNAVKRIFRYLKHQPKLGLWYPRDSPFELEAYSDSDYGGASLDRKSTTGGCQFLGRRLISWQCKKQTIVANSTTEAEYVAAANCCGQRLIEVIKIHTNHNVADLLTKGFDVTRISMDLRMDRSCAANSSYTWSISLKVLLLGAAMDPGEGSAQPAEPHHTPVDPLPSTSLPPIPSPPHSPHQSPPHSPHQSPPHSPHQSPPYSPPHYSPPRIETLETELQQTKTTYGKAVLTLVKRVKILEKALKRKTQKVVISESEGEEPEDQGRIIQDIDDDPLVSLVRESMKMKEKSTDFVTPTKASGEAQEEDISPTILEAAKTLSKVASQGVSKVKSTDKGKRYRRRARSVAKNINTGLDVEEEINKW
ncbi:hypothetical protein Tco_1029789 [Tanacetum coccineum]|uniref:Uncharacterized protein n=1 Tax=Tanacetum coccineum TaxID=301880 RepID=A0ABQ5G5N3_9ASTR